MSQMNQMLQMLRVTLQMQEWRRPACRGQIPPFNGADGRRNQFRAALGRWLAGFGATVQRLGHRLAGTEEMQTTRGVR